jgi:hypothetical protein
LPLAPLSLASRPPSPLLAPGQGVLLWQLPGHSEVEDGAEDPLALLEQPGVVLQGRFLRVEVPGGVLVDLLAAVVV